MEAADDFPDIGDYALVGNCRTAALVSRDGAVEWMCLPTFANEAIFAAILDRRAGHFALRPKGEYAATRRYVDDTNVLETTFKADGGTLRLTDCMTLPVARQPLLEPEHELLRRVECVEGEVTLEAAFAPREDYGRRPFAFANHRKLGWQFVGCPFGARLLTDVELREDRAGGRLVGEARLRAGDKRWFSFAYDQHEIGVVPPLGDEAQLRLDATIRWWKSWSAGTRYDGPYRDMVMRSALALKLMTCCTSGAVVAAPTTSLPEVAGGPRNWDYRFCWIRDSALVLHAFLSLGFVAEAEGFLEWLLHATRLTWQRFQVMYDIYGETKLDEKTLDYLGGYRGAKPVRIGNAAHDQLQLDIYGELLETIVQYVGAGGSLDRAESRMLGGVGRHVLRLWREPDQGIWETRAAPRHHTFSKAMCWVALDRLRQLADRFPIGLDRAHLERECDAIRAEIDEKGFDRERGAYVSYFGGHAADASLLLLARYGYAEPGSERMEGTYRFIDETLCDNGFVRRYREDASYDGIRAHENAFAPCNFWAAEYLANAGHDARAKRLFEHLCRYANDVGLFAEEIAIGTGKPVGNFPQAFTHVSLISAATALYKHKTA